MSRSEQPKALDASDLPLTLLVEGTTPGYLQLANQLHALIESGALRAGMKLPSSRALAQTLRINRNTVVAAFERLTSLGLIETRGRGGSIVAELPMLTTRSASDGRSSLRGVASKRVAHRPRIDFRLGSADPSPLPVKVWRRACREAGRHLPGPDYGDPRGDVELRSQVALYLGRTRAMQVNPDELYIITAGSGQAIERIAEVRLRPGDSAAVEEPGYPRAAKVFQRFAGRLVPIPVDGDGVNTDRLLSETGDIRLIHVTPSHQYPLGARLSSARRHSLIRWAREKDALIIENDYDGEFRYGAAPLPALGALAGFEHIAFVGTFSKVLSPAIRLGFVVRTDLIEGMAEVVAQARESVSIVAQRIVAWLIKSGELEKHIRRTRMSYSSRRAVMLRALGELPQVQSVSGHAAGLHVVLELHADVAPKRVSVGLESQGIVVDRVADFQVGQPTDTRLLMAYGHLSEAEIPRVSADWALQYADNSGSSPALFDGSSHSARMRYAISRLAFLSTVTKVSVPQEELRGGLMLILTRRVGESLKIGEEVTVTVLGIKGNQVRVGIAAPKSVAVHREEIFERIKAEQVAPPVE